jgi:hypothetical protein
VRQAGVHQSLMGNAQRRRRRVYLEIRAFRMVCTPSAPWRSWLEPRKPKVSSDPQMMDLGLRACVRACACSKDPECLLSLFVQRGIKQTVRQPNYTRRQSPTPTFEPRCRRRLFSHHAHPRLSACLELQPSTPALAQRPYMCLQPRHAHRRGGE